MIGSKLILSLEQNENIYENFQHILRIPGY